MKYLEVVSQYECIVLSMAVPPPEGKHIPKMYGYHGHRRQTISAGETVLKLPLRYPSSKLRRG